ncbi:MAG: hypothetical protein AAGH19_12620 [Pseudomonadota bacterium]
MLPPLRIGIATPMANPTVEPELRALFPPEVNMLVTRSVAEGDSKTRLIRYFKQLPETLDSFGGMRLHAFGFACTASSYLLDAGLEKKTCAALAKRHGYSVITASGAIKAALHQQRIRRLAIASPYPAWIATACAAFWERQGFDVVASSSAAERMEDTRAIYTLDPLKAAEHFTADFTGVEADALLITGTGLPTLPLLDSVEQALDLPVLTSNQCLAKACLAAARDSA